jgi:SAM-dependent methyltransferase
MARRLTTKAPAQHIPPHDAFHRHRAAQGDRARVLSSLLIPLASDFSIPLRRAPDVALACREAFGEISGDTLLPLRQLQGIIGAHEWRKKGVEIAELGGRIHPHYGVFSPVRGEYLKLVADAPLPEDCSLAFDIGTGTGVLAALLAKRGVEQVIATDQDPRALACAGDNLARLGYANRVDVIATDLFPPGRAKLVVCNPPWVPATPVAGIENAVYDPGSRMLNGFLNGLAGHLEPHGEGWLILSDLAEHLGLRSREQLLAMVESAGLKILDRLDIRPQHPRSSDVSDPLHAARAAEVTSLWRLSAA